MDPLRLRLVSTDPQVRGALVMVAATHDAVATARALAAASPEAARAFERAVRVHRNAVQDVLEPAARDAEARRARLMAAHPPDLAALAGRVVWRVDGDRVLAVEAMLRRNPTWRDPALWNAPECVRYLAKCVTSEATFRGARRRAREADLPRAANWWTGSNGREVWGRTRIPPSKRGDRRGSPTEAAVQGREAGARRMKRLNALAKRFDAPPALRAALVLAVKHDLTMGEALRRAGAPPSVFRNWRDRVRRGRAKGLTSPERKSGRVRGV